jgi:hypothetical protein
MPERTVLLADAVLVPVEASLVSVGAEFVPVGELLVPVGATLVPVEDATLVGLMVEVERGVVEVAATGLAMTGEGSLMKG